jgi:hypothetical protein
MTKLRCAYGARLPDGTCPPAPRKGKGTKKRKTSTKKKTRAQKLKEKEKSCKYGVNKRTLKCKRKPKSMKKATTGKKKKKASSTKKKKKLTKGKKKASSTKKKKKSTKGKKKKTKPPCKYGRRNPKTGRCPREKVAKAAQKKCEKITTEKMCRKHPECVVSYVRGVPTCRRKKFRLARKTSPSNIPRPIFYTDVNRTKKSFLESIKGEGERGALPEKKFKEKDKVKFKTEFFNDNKNVLGLQMNTDKKSRKGRVYTVQKYDSPFFQAERRDEVWSLNIAGTKDDDKNVIINTAEKFLEKAN